MSLNFNGINIGGGGNYLKTDASNLTATGKSTVCGLAVPGGTKETLEFPDNYANVRSKKSFTATDSGYFTVQGIVGGTSSNVGYCYIGNTTTGAIANQVTAPGASGINTFLPVYKGQTVLISTFNVTDASKVVSFVALKGAETVNNS